MKKAYLIHGTSTRDDDWFPWLEQAAKPGIDLDRLWLPDPFSPHRQEWDAAIDQQIPASDQLILVAHSLGCISALRYVERHHLRDVRLLLVGAFDQPLPAYPQLNEFVTPAVDYHLITPRVTKATVITAKDDPIAPYQGSVAVAHHLGAKLIVQETGGHFLGPDGFTEFPLALKELQRIAN
ncbi:RBBP9/YdeN family alpha/beta hydrolase [Limosilactobacillus sp.]|uniref:RBBP9/YdeN family alpha/beta hydrolase n=1 Tax=Limosilactobacillus sp. TaxID=2773925 RepID=UPI003F028571